jgi:hypothetical protein
MQNFNHWAVKTLVMIALLLAPVKSTMIAIGVLIVADLVTGLIAAITKRERIVSAKLRKTVSKMVTYELAIIAGFVLETYLVPDVPFIKIAAGVIGMSEAKSLFENIAQITGVDVLPMLLKKMQGGDYADLLKTETKPVPSTTPEK